MVKELRQGASEHVRGTVVIEPLLRAMVACASEADGIAGRCSRAVQLRKHVLTAAEHAVDVWEAAVSA